MKKISLSFLMAIIILVAPCISYSAEVSVSGLPVLGTVADDDYMVCTDESTTPDVTSKCTMSVLKTYMGASPTLVTPTVDSIYLTEQASALSDIAGLGQIWVKNDSPNSLYYTNDDGTDFQVTGGDTIADYTENKTPSPTNDGVWVVDEIEGSAADNYTLLQNLGAGIIIKETKCAYIEDPQNAEFFRSLIQNETDVTWTLTGMKCETDQSVTMNWHVDDGTPEIIDAADLTCATSSEDQTLAGGDSELIDTERLDLEIVTTSGTPTWVSACIIYTRPLFAGGVE